MAEKTKLLTSLTEVTTINTTDRLLLTDGNGHAERISLAALKAALFQDYDMNDVYDNVFIMFHRKSDNFPLAVKPQYWSGYANTEIPEGILVIEGGHHLVVALDEAAALPWSSAEVNGNTVFGYYADRQKAFTDFNGQQNTKNIVAATTDKIITNTADYAPGYCNLYSKVNANGKGLTAGRWWLPSIGELLMIYSNMKKINYCLKLVHGTQLQRTWYWSSSEINAAIAWNLNLLDGYLYPWLAKVSNRRHVRPVSAFLN